MSLVTEVYLMFHRSRQSCVSPDLCASKDKNKSLEILRPHIKPCLSLQFPYCMYSYNKEKMRLAIDSDTTDGCCETRYNKIWRWCASRFCKAVLIHDVDKNATSALRNLEAQLAVEIMAVMVRASKQAKCRGILFLHRVTATLLYQPCRV